MPSRQTPGSQHQQFADFVAECRFFDEHGMLDLEKFCVHLRLCLYCDGAPAPDPVALYEAMLTRIGAARDRIERSHIRRAAVEDWDDSLVSYYPDRQRTLVHFDALAIVYPDWIRRAGEELLGHANPERRPGRYWVQPVWVLTTAYLSRFEAEMVRVGGLARILEPKGLLPN